MLPCGRVLTQWRRASVLHRLGHRDVALPALVLQLDVLDGDGVGVGVEVGQRLVLGHPAPVDLVGEGDLAGLVVDVDQDVLAEIPERDLGAEPGADPFHTLLAHSLEFEVMGDAAFKRDRLELAAPGRLAAARRVAAFAMLHDLGRALQHPDLAHPRDVLPVPLHAELEVLVGIEALRH